MDIYPEYNPFDLRTLPGYGLRMFDTTLDVTETLIKQTLSLRRIAPLPEAQRSAQSLHSVFDYFLRQGSNERDSSSSTERDSPVMLSEAKHQRSEASPGLSRPTLRCAEA